MKLCADIYPSHQFVTLGGADRPPGGSLNISTSSIGPVECEEMVLLSPPPSAQPVAAATFPQLLHFTGICHITGAGTSPVDSCHAIAHPTFQILGL